MKVSSRRAMCPRLFFDCFGHRQSARSLGGDAAGGGAGHKRCPFEDERDEIQGWRVAGLADIKIRKA